VLKQAGLSLAEVEEMYQVMAIANYEDRFVIPSAHREYAENAFDMPGRLRLLVWQRLLRRRVRDQHVWWQEAAHHPDQGHGLSAGKGITMFKKNTDLRAPDLARPGATC
jgi:nitrate reductase beta subunit